LEVPEQTLHIVQLQFSLKMYPCISVWEKTSSCVLDLEKDQSKQSKAVAKLQHPVLVLTSLQQSFDHPPCVNVSVFSQAVLNVAMNFAQGDLNLLRNDF